MKAVRQVGVGLIVSMVTVVAFAATTDARIVGSALHHSRTGHHHSRHHKPLHGSWGSHDRAVYAVSTLNAPLCPSGQQLSTVLWKQYNARLFNVLGSTTIQGLFFVQVKSASGNQIGVYSYQFGNKLPDGVVGSRCVSNAGSAAVAGFKAKAWKFIAQFTSTYPKS